MKKLKIVLYSFALIILTYFISFSFIKFQFVKEINQCFDNIEEITNTEKHKLLSKANLNANNNFFLQIDNFSDCFTVKTIEYEVVGLKKLKIDTIQFKFYENILPGQTLTTVINEIKLDSIINFSFEITKISL